MTRLFGTDGVRGAAAALPMTLAEYAPTYAKGDRILCMGVGSGLNTALMEITW